jgi:N-acetylglucosamine-6-phosphate deacetylase
MAADGATAVVADRLFDGSRLSTGMAVVHRAGRIEAVIPAGSLPPQMPCLHLPEGALLAPGFIDTQVNGGGGVLLNEEPTPEGFAAIARAHRAFGTTGCLPTLITDRWEVVEDALAAIPAAIRQPGVLGLHLEGPFLNLARKGVHRAELFLQLDEKHRKALADAAGACPLLLTLAPECVPEGFVAALVQAGIIVAAGHSDASAAQAIAAADVGLRGVTHLYNAMSQLSGRAPGVVGAALSDTRLFAGIICDGLHVDPIGLRVALRAMGAARLMLVTDAMPLIGTDQTRFDLLGREVRLEAGRLTVPDGTLAGAHLSMIEAVRNAMRLMGATLEDALTMASTTPARFLGLSDELGALAPNHKADMVALDADMNVLGTWIGGEVAWVA